jgi:hypothetical protein
MIKDFAAYKGIFFFYSGDYYYVKNISFCKGGGLIIWLILRLLGDVIFFTFSSFFLTVYPFLAAAYISYIITIYHAAVLLLRSII